jgi:hypothetical protein
MSQSKSFSQRVNQLFFGINVSNRSASLIDSFRAIPDLTYKHYDGRQWNLGVAMEMNSDKAWSSKHEFLFKKSPLPDLAIDNGFIEVILGETDSLKKILKLNWQLQFSDKLSADKYFKTLKTFFSEVSSKEKFEHDQDVGDIAQFACRKPTDLGVRDITLFCGKSKFSNMYEVAVMFGTEFIDE